MHYKMHNQDPIEVGFTGGFHHPLLHYKNDNGDFVKRFSKYRKAGLVPSPAAVSVNHVKFDIII